MTQLCIPIEEMTTRSGTNYQARSNFKTKANGIVKDKPKLIDKVLADALAIKIDSSGIRPFHGMDEDFKCDSLITFLMVLQREITIFTPDKCPPKLILQQEHFCSLCKLILANYTHLKIIPELRQVIYEKIKEFLPKTTGITHTALVKYEKVLSM